MPVFKKPEDQGDSELESQRTILPVLEFRFFFILKGERMWFVAANVLVLGSFVLAGIHIGRLSHNVPVNSKRNVILFSATLYLCMNEKLLYL